MARQDYIFTSESVSEGHPDKLCDRVSDAILDLYLRSDPEARVAAETFATTNRVVIGGEVRCAQEITPAQIEDEVRGAIRSIGYEQDGFHWQTANVEVLLHEQSSHIAQGVDAKDDAGEGAGDQGIMFGYAVNETEALMPAPIHFSHRILENLAQARRNDLCDILGPDAKSQVSVVYENGIPKAIDSLVVSTQHLDEGLSSADIEAAIKPYVLEVLPEGWVTDKTTWYVNPTGAFVIGGPDGDAGLTGRKIIVDTYGGAAPHGGGAFSGKDPTKVDRSAAYAARYLAKNIVAAGLANRCTLQLAYAIGVTHPLSIYIDLGEGAKVSAEHLERALPNVMDLSPRGIRTHLGLNKPIYAPTAAYGHFGRTPTEEGCFSWEKTDLVDDLLKAIG